MNIMRLLPLPTPNPAIFNLLILLLEEAHEARPVVPAVALGPEAHLVVVGLVGRELGEPGLGKVPQRVGGLRGAVGRLAGLLAAKGAGLVRDVPPGWDVAVREVRGVDAAFLLDD